MATNYAMLNCIMPAESFSKTKFKSAARSEIASERTQVNAPHALK